MFGLWQTKEQKEVDANATCDKCVEVVRLLLAHGAHLDAPNEIGETALHIAADRGNTAVVQTLLESDKSLLRRCDREGNTALHIAAAKGDATTVTTLLQIVKDDSCIDATNHAGESALFVAAANGHVDAVKALAHANAKTHRVSNNGSTLLHVVARRGRSDALCYYALSNCGDALETRDEMGRTPLYVAAEKGSAGAVTAFLEAQADLFAINKVDKMTVLMAAATNNHGNVVNVLLSQLVPTMTADDTASYRVLMTYPKVLLAAQAHLGQRNATRKTAIEIASSATKKLIENGVTSLQADLDRTHLAIQAKEAALANAIKSQEWTTAKQLLREGVPVTSLDLAGDIVNAGDAELLLTLVRAIMEANNMMLLQTLIRTPELSKPARNQLAQEALVTAVTSGKTLFAMNLLRMADVNLNLVTTEGPSPMHLAAKSGSDRVLSMLLVASRADVDTINEGNTALAIAVHEGHVDAAKVLVSAGANPSFVLPSGHTVLAMAVRRGQQELAQLLHDGIYTTVPTVTAAAFSGLEHLPNGGFGAIEKVKWSNKCNDDVLIRKRPLYNQGWANELFRSEIQLMQSVRSPYLLPALAIVDNPTDGVQVVTPYMSDGDLFHYLKKQRTSTPNDGSDSNVEFSIVHVAWVVANGLAYLHAKNIIHRDLKSLNVFLCAKHGVVLGDFGIARSIERDMTAGAGTDLWTAPEVLREKEDEEGRVYDALADVYSFGVILTELDTGREPYADSTRNRSQILTQVRTNKMRPTMSDSCPQWLADLAAACLSFDPLQRPTADEIVAVLAPHLDDDRKAGDGRLVPAP